MYVGVLIQLTMACSALLIDDVDGGEEDKYGWSLRRMTSEVSGSCVIAASVSVCVCVCVCFDIHQIIR